MTITPTIITGRGSEEGASGSELGSFTMVLPAWGVAAKEMRYRRPLREPRAAGDTVFEQSFKLAFEQCRGPMSAYDDRRDQLFQAAARVFAEGGYDRTSMRDLARESRMSLAGMYYYVKGKEDLLFQIQKSCFERVYEGARAALAPE